MTATPEERPLPPSWRIVRAIATLVAAAVLMLVVADWGWRWFAPASKPIPMITETNQSPASAIDAAPWFGSRSTATASVPVANTAAAGSGLQGDARLLGIIARHDGSGYALFRFPDRGPVIVTTGQPLAPGVTLQAITASGVRVSDRGEVREIALRPAASGSSTVVKSAVTSPRAASLAACAPPGGANGPTYRLNAELLTGIAAKPDSWSNAFTGGSDGLSMREGNAFGSMLGMKPGDRVTQANGVALRGVEDVLVAVIRPLLASQPVRVTGVREGRPAEWIFVNASACPA